MTEALPQPGGSGPYSGAGPFRFWSRQRDAGRIVTESGLPASIQSLVLNVTRASRLWRRERADLAVELCAHFGDGLEAGRNAEQLIADFGNPMTAARLIRRGKIRCRPLPWKIFRWTGRSLAALLVIYIGLIFYYLGGEPTISTDYYAKFNAAALAVSPEDRAWPIYRKAFLTLKDRKDAPWDRYTRAPLPGEEGWDQTAAYLDRHRQALDLIRRAARKPGLGFVTSHRLSSEDRAVYGADETVLDTESDSVSTVHPLKHSLAAMLLPHLVEMRTSADLLSFSAIRAASEGKGSKAIDDIETMIGIARHLKEQPSLINDLVMLSIVTQACDVVHRMIQRHGALLKKEDLKRLAHVVAQTEGWMSVRLDGERMMFYDIVQRIYTDDGDGDGHLMASSLDALVQINSLMASDQGAGRWRPTLLSTAALPALNALAPSRRQAIEDYDREMGRMESRFSKPLWQMGDSDFEDRMRGWKSSWRSTARYILLMMLMPAVERAHVISEVAVLRRDATYVLIGAELYRREHGDWPRSLQALSPRWLPRVPLDRFDGKPLRFHVTEKGPVIYSVGADLNDDGGKRAQRDEAGRPIEPHEAQSWRSPGDLAAVRRSGGAGLADGDLVFYPPLIKPIEKTGGQEEPESHRSGHPDTSEPWQVVPCVEAVSR